MFEVFKNQKNSIMETGATNQTAEVNYMSANEARRLAHKKWTTLPTEEIFQKIEKLAKNGHRDAHFSDAYINGKQLTMLRELGYKVEIYTSKEHNPFFVVSW